MEDENNLNAETLGDSGEHSSKSTGADSEKISVMDYCINRLTAITQELNKFKFNNDITDEWVEEMKEKNKKTIVLSIAYAVRDNRPLQHYVELSPKDKYRSDEWRNTQEKIDEIKQYFRKYEVKDINFSCEYLPKENINFLMLQGWEFEGYCDDVEY